MAKRDEIFVGKPHLVVTLQKEGYFIRKIGAKLNLSRNCVHNIGRLFHTEGRIMNDPDRGRE